MPIPIYLPRFDPTHERSTIIRWLVNEGDSVHAGDAVCEVSSDKVDMEIEAPDDGIVAGVRFLAGEEAATTEILAYLLHPGESPAAIIPVVQASPVQELGPSQATVTPVVQRIAQVNNINLAQIQGSGPGGHITRRDVEAATITSPGRVNATSAAR